MTDTSRLKNSKNLVDRTQVLHSYPYLPYMCFGMWVPIPPVHASTKEVLHPMQDSLLLHFLRRGTHDPIKRFNL